MTLKIFVDRLSQPSRAVVLFCKLNKIDFEEVRIDLAKRQHLTPEFAEINPMLQVPAMVDGRFKLFESHAILIYLACSFPSVADHWYPAGVSKRAKIHSVLDWHHSNLRAGAIQSPDIICQAGCGDLCTATGVDPVVGQVWEGPNGILHTLANLPPESLIAMKYVFNSTIAPALGRPLNLQVAAEAKKILDSSLSKLESIWLKGSGKFLLGSNQPSIADLSLVCEIMQLEVLDAEDRARILDPYKKVQGWVQATKDATKPHFDDVHGILFKAKIVFEKQRETNRAQAGSKAALHSKI